MNQYSSYKDSGVEWIGEIPSHWDVMKLKYLSRITPSSVDKHIFDDESLEALLIELDNQEDHRTH